MILAVWYHAVLAFVFAAVAILLMIVILLQRGKGVGLAGAFGGTGGHAAFGAKTGDVLTWVTVAGAALLLVMAILLNYVFVDAPPTLAPGGSGSPGAAPGETPGGSSWHLEQDATAPMYAQLPVFGESIT